MYAIEFEADVVNGSIKIPEEYKGLESKHLKAIILLSKDPGARKKSMKYDFSDLSGKLSWEGDAVAEQRKVRDEWN